MTHQIAPSGEDPSVTAMLPAAKALIALWPTLIVRMRSAVRCCGIEPHVFVGLLLAAARLRLALKCVLILLWSLVSALQSHPSSNVQGGVVLCGGRK